jgi:hypothetical protein
MPLRSRDEEFDEFDDYDIDLDQELEDEATVDCPYCGEEIYEDANWCPFCTNYISREDAPPARRPWWLVAGICVCLAIVVSWFFVL